MLSVPPCYFGSMINVFAAAADLHTTCPKGICTIYHVAGKAAPDMNALGQEYGLNEVTAALRRIGAAPVKVARIYMRVSTEEQDLARQDAIAQAAKLAGYYVAGIYREKASGARADRPELLRMIDDLQPGETVVAEKLVASIRAKGARLAVSGVVDLGELAAGAQGVARIVLESVQEMLLKLALQIARDDYEDRRERQRQGVELVKLAGKYIGRKADTITHERIIALRRSGHSIAQKEKPGVKSPVR